MRALTLGLALSAIAGCSGCYESHGERDGGPDVRVPNDAGPCRTPAGVLTCGTPECPATTCEPYPVDVGLDVCRRPTAGGELGICRYDLSGDFASSMDSPCMRSGISQPILSYPPGSVFTYCGADGLCDDFRTLGFTAAEAACYYSDGSPYVNGVVPVVDCGGVPGACGHGCPACPSQQACFGPSEQSGLGVCVPTEDDGFGHDVITTGELFECGMVRDRFLDCPISHGCLTFVVEDRLEGWERGRCVEVDTCLALGAAHPERYRCNPDG